MSFFSRDELRTLVERDEGPCVSIFMPTHRAGAETQQNPIRVKNLTREAEKQLIEGGLPSRGAKELLVPLKGLLEDALFWRYQSDGLAMFSSVALFRCYRLPVTFDELVRTLGLAYVWQIIGVLGVLSAFSTALACLLAPVMVIAAILLVVAWFIAAKEALDLDWVKTIITVILGWLALIIITAIAGVVVGLLGFGGAVLGGLLGS